MKYNKSIAGWLGIFVLIAGYVFYNDAFMSIPSGDSIIRKLTPILYVTHFDSNQQTPATFFSAPAFPSYMQWCNKEQQLCSVLPLQQLYADVQWLGSIQFVGSQGMQEGIVGLAVLLDNLTNITPYRQYPYIFGQLLVPLPKIAPKVITQETKDRSYAKAHLLAQKGEFYVCDAAKVKAIRAMDVPTFSKLIYDSGAKEQYANPCPTYELPHFAAFNEFHYLNDNIESAQDYKISAFTQDSPPLAPIMAALVYGKGGEHLKSATLWFDRFTILSQDNADLLSGDATRSLKKAIYEIQLQLLTEAGSGTSEECSKSYTCLQSQGLLKQSIEHSFSDICDNGKNTQNIRCILLDLGLQQHLISRQGTLVYPMDTGYTFGWDTEQQGRRPVLQEKK